MGRAQRMDEPLYFLVLVAPASLIGSELSVCLAPPLVCAENPAKFYSGYSDNRASLVAGPRSVLADGYPLENPAKTEAQAGRGAPVGKIGNVSCPMDVPFPWRSFSSTFAPRPLRTCASAL